MKHDEKNGLSQRKEAARGRDAVSNQAATSSAQAKKKAGSASAHVKETPHMQEVLSMPALLCQPSVPLHSVTAQPLNLLHNLSHAGLAGLELMEPDALCLAAVIICCWPSWLAVRRRTRTGNNRWAPLSRPT